MVASWARVDILILDDLAPQPLTPAQSQRSPRDVEDRAQRRSTIDTNQLPVAGWHDSLGDATVADAILDRLVHDAHRIEPRGDSPRRPQTGADERAPASATIENELTAATTRLGQGNETLRHP